MAYRVIRALRFAVAILLASVVTLAADPALPQDFPRLSLYGSLYEDGFPLLDASGAIDQANMDRIARYDVVTLDVSPITPYRPDLAAELRARHPGIVLLGYYAPEYTSNPSFDDSLVHFPTRFQRLVRDLDGYLYNQYGELNGTRFEQWANVNMAKRDAGGRLVVAEGIANLFYDAIISSGVWDGMFLDTFCADIQWVQAFGESIDVQRAGYPDWDSFAASWQAGTDTLASRLRALAGPDFILVGNCGQSDRYALFNGWMRERFPYQNGGNWYANMFRDPGGYFIDEQRHRTPHYNYIYSTIPVGTDPYTTESSRVERFGLGSAALGDGFGVFGVPERKVRSVLYHEWWFDEYAVDLTTGRASTQAGDTGWLGQALGPAYQMVWLSGNADAIANPGFETDLSGWRLGTDIGSTLERDASSVGAGAWSAHVTVPQAGASPWSTSLRSDGSISVSQGLPHAATFWARADRPRAIRVAAGKTIGGGEWVSQRVDLTTAWKRYQVILIPTGTGQADLQFHLAEEVGDVWLDDVHFQAGVTNIWRRDFQNGIVLVNPAQQALAVPLERPYQRILGATDPVTNNGARASQITLPPNDALFLIGEDKTSPADVADLRPVPPPTP